MYILFEVGKTIFIKSRILEMQKRREVMKKRNTSARRERLILLSATAFVLTALTMTGVYMREKKNTTDESRIQVKEIGVEEVSEKASQIAVNEDGYQNANDMDADPDTWEVDTYNVKAILEEESEQKEEIVLASSEVIPTEEEPVSEEVVETSAGVSNGHLVFPKEKKMVWPIVGEITMNYSMDKTVYFETLGQYRYNPAVVIAGTPGEVVKAPANCVVKEIGSNVEIGKYMVLELGEGYEVTLGQLDGMNFKKGDAVEKGVVLATLAPPSIYYSAEGANLYMKLEKDDAPVNPMDVLD